MAYALYRMAYALHVFKRYDEEEVNAEPTGEAHAWQARVDVGPGSCVLSLIATHRCSSSMKVDSETLHPIRCMHDVDARELTQSALLVHIHVWDDIH